MQICTYRMTFITPAFLGDAEQSGRWRTPPIKALLRQWWRVAYSAERGHRVDVSDMRRDEHKLFGTVDGEAHRSLLRLRLSRWDAGGMASWDRLEAAPVPHPEVPRPVGPHLYLGYGPLVVNAGQTSMKPGKCAIAPGESAAVSLALPEDGQARTLLCALDLIDLYGAIGGRSRNGWGSFTLRRDGSGRAGEVLPEVSRDWQEALSFDWPHAIGTDGRPLIWQTPPCPDWRAAMRRLAQVKIALRTQPGFRFTTGPNATAPEDRHWLAYPVTKHSVRSWGNGQRLPNTLRFRLRAVGDNQVAGVVFHMPCRPPDSFSSATQTLTRVWRTVHSFLDDETNGLQLQRIPH